MNSNQIKELIKATINNFIGTYTVSNKTVTAIATGNPPHNVAKKTGLEVLLNVAPVNTKPGMNTIDMEYIVTLVQHPGTTPTIEQALEKLSRLDICTNITFLPAIALATPDLLIPDQAIVTLCEKVPVKIIYS